MWPFKSRTATRVAVPYFSTLCVCGDCFTWPHPGQLYRNLCISSKRDGVSFAHLLRVFSSACASVEIRNSYQSFSILPWSRQFVCLPMVTWAFFSSALHYFSKFSNGFEVPEELRGSAVHYLSQICPTLLLFCKIAGEWDEKSWRITKRERPPCENGYLPWGW